MKNKTFFYQSHKRKRILKTPICFGPQRSKIRWAKKSLHINPTNNLNPKRLEQPAGYCLQFRSSMHDYLTIFFPIKVGCNSAWLSCRYRDGCDLHFTNLCLLVIL